MCEGNQRVFHKKHKLVLIILILPLIIGNIFLYFIFGNLTDAFMKMFELKGRPNVTSDAVTSLSNILALILTIYSILITAVFSYLVWRVSQGSLQVSRELKNLEVHRDSESEREQALIVYYDIQRGFSYLRNLYISLLLKNQNPNPIRLFFSDDWIKNVASLRNKLSRSELNKVYELYNEFYIDSLIADFSINNISLCV